MNFDRFIAWSGLRPYRRQPDPKFMSGGFRFYGTVTDNTASWTNKLNSTTGVGKDKRITKAYGTSATPEAIVHIEAVQVVFYEKTARDLTEAEKQVIIEELYLEVTVANDTRQWSLGQHVRWLFSESGNHGGENDTDSNINYQPGSGKPLVFSEPVELTMDVDTIQTGGDTAINHGGTLPYFLQWYGAIGPKNAQRAPYIEQGATCGGPDGPTDQQFLQRTLDVGRIINSSLAPFS